MCSYQWFIGLCGGILDQILIAPSNHVAAPQHRFPTVEKAQHLLEAEGKVRRRELPRKCPEERSRGLPIGISVGQTEVALKEQCEESLEIQPPPQGRGQP